MPHATTPVAPGAADLPGGSHGRRRESHGTAVGGRISGGGRCEDRGRGAAAERDQAYPSAPETRVRTPGGSAIADAGRRRTTRHLGRGGQVPSAARAAGSSCPPRET